MTGKSEFFKARGKRIKRALEDRHLAESVSTATLLDVSPVKRKLRRKTAHIICRHCQQSKPARNPKVQIYCSRACQVEARKASGNYVTTGRRGGETTAKMMRSTMIEKYKSLSGGLEGWEAFRAGAKWQLARLRNITTKKVKKQIEAAERRRLQGWAA